jgi:ABC-type branched-subunit amino acid transport system substrate-binding protein
MVLISVVACSSNKSNSASGSKAPASAAPAKSLLSNTGQCNSSLPKYPLGIVAPIQSAALSLKDDALAADAAVKAFNSRGGIGQHCMELTVCDSQGDPNKEVDCARQFVANGVVATVSDVSSFNPQGTLEVLEAAGLPRVGISPSTQDLKSKVAFPMEGGGAGTTYMQVVGCTRNGNTKLAAIHVATPAIQVLFSSMATMLKAYNADFVTKVPVSQGTTDFQQFTLAAKKAGATCAIVPLGQNEAVQVIQAAQQLGTDLKFSGSANSFNLKDAKAFGDFSKQLYLNGAYPPPQGSQTTWPILREVLADLAASGKPELQGDAVKPPAERSWMAVYALKTIVEKFGHPDDISRAAITTAVKSAKDVDMFGLIPPWTPSLSVSKSFPAVSNPYYYVFHLENGKYVVSDKLYNFTNELVGNITYAQPTAGSNAPVAATTTSTP